MAQQPVSNAGRENVGLPDHHEKICPRCGREALQRRADFSEPVRMTARETIVLHAMSGHECLACSVELLDGMSRHRLFTAQLESDVEWMGPTSMLWGASLWENEPEDLCKECGGALPFCPRTHHEDPGRLCCSCYEAGYCPLCVRTPRDPATV